MDDISKPLFVHYTFTTEDSNGDGWVVMKHEWILNATVHSAEDILSIIDTIKEFNPTYKEVVITNFRRME